MDSLIANAPAFPAAHLAACNDLFDVPKENIFNDTPRFPFFLSGVGKMKRFLTSQRERLISRTILKQLQINGILNFVYWRVLGLCQRFKVLRGERLICMSRYVNM